MAQGDALSHPSPDAPRRPKGILKNSNSFQQALPEEHTPSISPPTNGTQHAAGGPDSRPSIPAREISEKELTQMNTEINAGAGGHRRTSSNPRSSTSRRQSSQGGVDDAMSDDQGMRLKWDEANLYLNEGQMGGKMKIDEPKTPYAKQYDPMEDEMEVSRLNAQELAVDELEMDESKQPNRRPARDSEIPGLDLGEPEMATDMARDSDGDSKVLVETNGMDVDGNGHGEKREEDMSPSEWEKHKKFEEMRKKHYEMKDVKNLLGNPEDMDEDDDEDGVR